jgi:FtsH-binding integral membrane protein
MVFEWQILLFGVLVLVFIFGYLSNPESKATGGALTFIWIILAGSFIFFLFDGAASVWESLFNR